MADKKTRTDLRLLFAAGKIPTESNFADLIESGINQKDDGLQKTDRTPLKIQAPVTVEANAGAPKELILFYDKFDDASAKWKIGSRSGGLEISRGTESDFLINSGGGVGIGTAAPEGKLHIINQNQNANGDTLILGPTSQPNLRLGYDTEYTWIQSHQNKPLAINPLGNNVGIKTYNPIAPLSIGDSSVDGSDGFLVLGKKKNNGSRHLKIGYDDNWNFVVGDYGSNNTPGNWISQFAINYLAPENSFYIDNTGNVGIGTQKPAQKLHVAGNLRIDGELTTASSISAPSIFAQTNVGIGTTTPGFPLTFANEMGEKISLWGQAGAADSYGFGIGEGLLQIYTDTPDADVAFGYGSSKSLKETMRIKGRGNVGIGTKKPLGPLSIGDSSIDGSDGFLVLGKKTSDSSRHLKIGYDDNLNFVIGDYGTNNNEGEWISQFAMDYRAPENSFYIDKAGNIGIGTNTPAENLHVAGNLRVDGKLATKAAISAPSIFAESNIGIATATPGFPLTFADVVGEKISFWGQASGGNSYGIGIQSHLLQIYTTESKADVAFGYGASAMASFNETMRIKGNGSVGIGTTAPTGRLHISEATGTAGSPSEGTIVIDHENNGGTSSITFRSKVNRGSDYGYIQYQDVSKKGDGGESSRLIIGVENDDNDHLILRPTGNVGIGTDDPTAKLEVKGRIKDQTGFVMPVGSIVAFGGDLAPAGWLLCNGEAIPGDGIFNELRAVLGQSNTPDLRGRTLIAVGGNHSLKQTGGEENHILTVAEMPSHYHHGFGENSEWDFGTVGNNNHLGSAGAMDGDNYYFNTSPTGGGNSHNNMQPYYVVNYMIKY